MFPKETHGDFIKALGDESPFYSTVKKLTAEVRRERKSVENYERSSQSAFYVNLYRAVIGPSG